MGKMLRCLAKFYGFVTLPFPCALLAQLDRASDYESEGRWFESSRAHQFFSCFSCYWRVGRVAEGDGLLNRYTVKICIGGSNPPLSAIINTGRTLNRGFEPVPADAGTSNTGNPPLSAILDVETQNRLGVICRHTSCGLIFS